MPAEGERDGAGRVRRHAAVVVDGSVPAGTRS
jgi:hypothetical protein